MSPLLLVCLALLFLILVTGASILSRRFSTPQRGTTNHYKSRTYLCSQNELRFYEALREALPSMTIMSKVRLADIITPDYDKQEKPYHSAFNSIRSKHLDFVVCDSNLKILYAIELDDRTHNRKSRKARDQFVDKSLEQAGINLHRFRSTNHYSSETIRQRLTPTHATDQ